MNTMHYCDGKNKRLHPFPAALEPVIARFFRDTGRGFFTTGKYDTLELAYKTTEEGWEITDGSILQADTAEYWNEYREVLGMYYGDDVAAMYDAWQGL